MPFGRVLLEPVRSAEPPIISGTAAVRVSSAVSEATRVAISFGVAASFSFTARTAAASFSVGSSPRRRRSNSARRADAIAAKRSFQLWCAALPALPALRHSARTSAGMTKAGSGQPSRSRAPLISSAPSGEPWLFSVPALLGAPKPMVVRQAISDGRAEACAAAMALAIASGSCPSTRLAAQPAASKRFTWSTESDERQRPVDRDAVVVEQHDQLVELEVPGERDRLLADALHQIAVGGEHIGAMIDDLLPEHGGQVPLGDRHADRIAQALAERAGGGLHARRDEVLGMAGRERAELTEALDLLDGHGLVAEEMEQARRPASSRGRPKARSGRGRARRDRRGRTSGTA